MKPFRWSGSSIQRGPIHGITASLRVQGFKALSTKCIPRTTSSERWQHSAISPERDLVVRDGLWPLEEVKSYKGYQRLQGLTGAQLFHLMMLEYGVDHIFGHAGRETQPILDTMSKSPEIRYVSARHEQNAGHMAQGYSRATRRTGVVLVNSGSSSTNLVTPLQDALMDGTPLVAFCIQATTGLLGSNTSQEMDMFSIGSACTKWTVMVQNVAELPQRVNEAFEIAKAGRPGPVVVILPENVTRGALTEPIPVRRSILPPVKTWLAPDDSVAQLRRCIDRSVKLIDKAQKPIIFAGQGVLLSPDGPSALRSLAEKACIPVTTSLQGLGSFDEEDPKSLHMLGLHGSGFANMAIQEADLIIALGVRFDDRVTGSIPKFAPAAFHAARKGCGGIIHFDISPKSINKIVQATEGIIGDVGDNLSLLLRQIERVESRPEWFKQISEWKRQYAWRTYESTSDNRRIQPQAVISRLSKLTEHMKDRTIITTGVGQHQMWAAQYFRWRYPRTMITSGGLGTMGFGVPAAIGAKLGRQDALVVNIDGDASFCMSLNELATAAENDIAIKTIILNNEEQGMVTQLQNFYFNSRYAHSHQQNPDFVGVAQALGVNAQRADTADELNEKLRWLLDQPGPALLEVLVDSKLPVLPTVPAGKGLHEFVY